MLTHEGHATVLVIVKYNKMWGMPLPHLICLEYTLRYEEVRRNIIL